MDKVQKTVTSKDGTIIAFDQMGQGPAVIFVDGAFDYRGWNSVTPQLADAPLLAEHFTVYHHDRRGRGESGDTQPYAVEREIEDIEAIIDDAGGSAFIFGISSGAGLALEAAAALPGKIKKLAMYEPPYNDDEAARKAWKQYRADLTRVLAEGDRGKAADLFMMLVGMPEEQLEGTHQSPFWPSLEGAASTLAYDAAVLGDEAALPLERAASITVPVLVMNGTASEWSFMQTTAQALAKAMPKGQHRTLEGQTHDVWPDVLAPVLVEFFEA